MLNAHAASYVTQKVLPIRTFHQTQNDLIWGKITNIQVAVIKMWIPRYEVITDPGWQWRSVKQGEKSHLFQLRKMATNMWNWSRTNMCVAGTDKKHVSNSCQQQKMDSFQKAMRNCSCSRRRLCHSQRHRHRSNCTHVFLRQHPRMAPTRKLSFYYVLLLPSLGFVQKCALLCSVRLVCNVHAFSK